MAEGGRSEVECQLSIQAPDGLEHGGEMAGIGTNLGFEGYSTSESMCLSSSL